MPESPSCAVLLPIPASVGTNPDAVLTRFGGAAAIAHCLTAMLEPNGAITPTAVVAVAEALRTDVEAALTDTGITATVVVADFPGGRAECLSAGLATLDDTLRFVLVHDIRRPLASARLRDRVITALVAGHDVVVPALAMVDSVKAVDRAGTVTETVDREHLRAAQFPRGFTRDVLADLVRGGGPGFDELIQARRVGSPITPVAGDPDAFPLDMPRDAQLAAAILARRLG